MRNKSVLVLFFVLIISSLSAQKATVKGFVTDKETGEPIIFTNVYLEGTNNGITTDINGFYNISKITPGDYILTCSYVGYETIKVPISLTANQVLSKNLLMVPSNVQIDDITVSAERQEMQTAVRTSVTKISPKQLTKIPTVGSDPDLAQYLQVLPGVIFTGDQGGQLYIRGGSSIQNKVLLDGMVVYNPFHSIGLFSVFDSDIIRNADVYSGGFGAEYGGRISSVMDITMKDGNKKKTSGKISTSTFGSKVLVEGPIIRNETSQNSGLSYIVSAKTSYLDKTSKSIYSYINEEGMPYSFTDLYSKISLNSSGGSKINLTGFHFTDDVSYKNVSDLNWTSSGVGLNAVIIPGVSNFLVKANLSYSDYAINYQEINELPNYSRISGFKGGLDFTYFTGNNTFSYGLEAIGNSTAYEFYNSVGRKIGRGEEISTTEMALYATYKYTHNKWLIEPGLRLHYYASIPYASLEPRLGIKYKASDKLRIKFGGGLYSQNLVSAVSEREVVNLFSGFLSGSYNLQDEFNGGEPVADLQLSQHAILGMEYDITNYFTFQMEGYIKFNPQLIVLNRNKIYNDTYANADEPDYFKKDFILEEGNAYGLDFVLKYDYNQLYVWLVYSLGKVTRFDGVYEYYPHFDRRHNVNFVASYVFGEDLDWEVNGRWNLGSGFPTLMTQGFYELLPFTDGISTDYTSANGNIGVLYSSIDQKVRLPYYHRLDLTLKKNFALSAESNIELSLSVTNVYNRNNIFYFDRITHERIDQLPFLPSFGMAYNF